MAGREEPTTAAGTRRTMVEGAMQLLATRGVHGASLGNVLKHTGAPRGSIYHHFPGGKDELISAALDEAGERHDAWIEQGGATSVCEVVDRFLAFWQHLLVSSDFQSGCPVLAVTVSAPDGMLHDKAGQVFTLSQERLCTLLQRAGAPDDAANELASLLLASGEGAVVLARAQHDLRPFLVVADHLRAHVASVSAGWEASSRLGRPGLDD